MATAPGRPPPKAFVRAARTSKPPDDVALRGAGDFLRPAGFRAGDLARGLRGDAAAPAEALAARVATIVCSCRLLLKFDVLKLGDVAVRSNAISGLRVHATANAGAICKSACPQVVPARNESRVSCLSALQSRALITNEPGRGERSVRDISIGEL